MNDNQKEIKIKEDLLKTTIIHKSITNELKDSFLEYSMSVIVSRALPDARDGLKPVHRRVLYGAYGLGLYSSRAYKKSARLVGDIIGKYHPHGDTAVYETMVRMSQDFSMRYQLMDGHGNFGSVDGDSAAAMRYTEIRMSKISDSILDDIDKDTVKFVDNYDGSESEPTVLPALFPNLLANGSNGIAVGMATNIPPHNLSELIEAIKMVANNPETTTEELKTVLHGPDFPTAASILGSKGIDDYFNTGRGSVIMRGKCSYTTNESSGKSTIIFNEIPYQVNKINLIERIVELVSDKENENNVLAGISDLRDETSREGIRIVIETKKDVSPEVIINHLYKKTALQTTFSVNMLALVNGEPKLLNVRQIIDIYILHQLDILNRKTNYELKADKERLHILEGIHIALQNIDAIVEIIRNTKADTSPEEQLMSKYNLDQRQVKSILDMRLRTLSGLETQKIVNEINELKVEIEGFETLIGSKELQIQTIITAIDNLNRRFGDKRRTEILYGADMNIDDEDLIKKEDILLTMSSHNYIKRLPVDTYRNQKRGGVGVIGANTYSDDDIARIIVASTHTDILIFTSIGKVYRLRGHNFPSGSRISKGLPAISFIPGISKGEKVITLYPINEYNEESCLLFVTKKGMIKKTKLNEYVRINRSGKIALRINEDDELFDVMSITDADQILLGSSKGLVNRFESADIRPIGRVAAGVRGMKLDGSSVIVGACINKDGEFLLSIGARGIGKLTPIEQYRLTSRNTKGVKTLKVTAKTDKLVATKAVNTADEVLIITTKNKVIRFSVDTIREASRNTQGVKLVNLDDGDKVRDVAVFKEEMFQDEIGEQPTEVVEATETETQE